MSLQNRSRNPQDQLKLLHYRPRWLRPRRHLTRAPDKTTGASSIGCVIPGGFTACMAEYRRRDRAIQSEEERMQFIYSWYVPPDKQPEEVRGTHGANEDYIWR
jgi:hypothetical protein